MESKKKLSDYLSDIQEFRTFDVDKEWKEFLNQAVIENSSDSDTKLVPITSFSKILKNKIIWSIAASMAVILAAYLVLIYTLPTYKTVSTTNDNLVIQLDEGSSILLAENSTLQYPRNTKKLEERKIILTGNATFDVSVNQKPFVVELNETAIKVLGTKFAVKFTQKAIDVENIEGQIRFYEIDNEENGVILNQGDKYRYEGGSFNTLNPTTPKHAIEDIFDHLLVNFPDLVKPVGGLIQVSKFEGKAIIPVDLEQDLKGIISQLENVADFQYTIGTCEGCIVIQIFKSK